jgi:uncharacterized protein YndB with AHSA1/START domain
MPEFTLTGATAAPVEEVWKLLFDPSRFPEWWAGIETVRVERPGEYTIWHAESPDFPMPQRLRADRVEGRVSVSCQVSDIGFSWQLAERGDGTQITVQVGLPPAMAGLYDEQREDIGRSLAALVRLAEAELRGDPPAVR